MCQAGAQARQSAQHQDETRDHQPGGQCWHLPGLLIQGHSPQQTPGEKINHLEGFPQKTGQFFAKLTVFRESMEWNFSIPNKNKFKSSKPANSFLRNAFTSLFQILSLHYKVIIDNKIIGEVAKEVVQIYKETPDSSDTVQLSLHVFPPSEPVSKCWTIYPGKIVTKTNFSFWTSDLSPKWNMRGVLRYYNVI